MNFWPAATNTIPFGAAIAGAGGLVAQVSQPTVGAAGLVVAITGLVVAGFQYYKAWLDSRNQSKVIEDLRADLLTTRQKRHGDANRINGLQLELTAEKMRTARLEGQLGVIDKSHSSAINENAANTQAIAEQTGSVLPSPLPHVDPVVGSDDELAIY